MPIDRTNPLIGFTSKERTVYEPTLALEWVTAKELTGLDGSPIERTFNELEYGSELELTVGSGPPSGSPDSYSHHYRLQTEMIEHTYTGKALYADGPPLSDFNEFYGWSHVGNVSLRTELWTDDLVRVVVYQMMSRPEEETPATDRVYFFDGAGATVSSSTLTEETHLEIDVERVWGMRTAATDSEVDFDMLSSNWILQNTFDRTVSCTGQQPTAVGVALPPPEAPDGSLVSGTAPNALTYPIIRVDPPFFTRPVITEMVLNPQTQLMEEVVVIRVVHEVHIYLYGTYWLQELEFVNSYSQPFLVHPLGTELAVRLKPPGKGDLSDAFNRFQGAFNPNAEWR